jgi:hypothetical protein
MTERDRGAESNDREGTAPSGGDAVTETAGTSSSSVRDVVGRRGYDEGEDETANEDEEH